MVKIKIQFTKDIELTKITDFLKANFIIVDQSAIYVRENNPIRKTIYFDLE
jgi:hypothetical protein